MNDEYIVFYDPRYEQRAIICLECNMVSYNDGDIDNLYCGYCHKFHTSKMPSSLVGEL